MHLTVERSDLARVLAGSWRREPPPPPHKPEIPPPDVLDAGAVTALVWRQLRSCPSPAVDGLRDRALLQAALQRVHEQGLERVVRAYRAGKVEKILQGKGWAIARRYPAIGLRPCGDVDLYLSPDAMAAAQQVSLIGNTVQLDLHRGCPDLDDRPFETLQERAVEVPLGDTVLRVLGDEDHLRLLCLHAMRHGMTRPIWLVDIALLVEEAGDRLDWDLVLSGSAYRRDAVGCALDLAGELLQARLPSPRPWPQILPRWAVRATRRAWKRPFVPRLAMRAHWRQGVRSWLPALIGRWPNPLEATAGVGGPYGRWPRLPIQLAECARRIAHAATLASLVSLAHRFVAGRGLA